MAAPQAGRGSQVAVHVEECGAGDVSLPIGALAGAAIAQGEPTVHDREPRLPEPVEQIGGLYERPQAASVLCATPGDHMHMRAMLLDAPGMPLRQAELPDPRANRGEVLLEVAACGVCRTDLHIVDGELDEPELPLVPGHQIVGRVVEDGRRFRAGDRVGVPWLGWTCGECRYCRSGRENLCDSARFTGYQRDGGYAELTVADERFCFPIPDGYPDLQAAPLLCAGLIGYRTLKLAGESERVGIYGFGAAAHIVCQVALHQGRRVFAFTRADDESAQSFALELGAEWAGDALAPAPEELDAALIFAPAGELVPAALRAVAKGGVVVCGGIHMSDIPQLPYELLWEERVLRSVANLTRADGEEFLALAPRVPVRTEVEAHPLERAGVALERLRSGSVRGAAVLVPGGS
jgi:propanol-preferring alcohol dehydrogenase